MIQRYDPYLTDDDNGWPEDGFKKAVMQESCSGDYVLYSDVLELIKGLHNIVEEKPHIDVDCIPQYLHGSMYGTYYIDCEILQEAGNMIYIRYIDPNNNETYEKWVEADYIRV